MKEPLVFEQLKPVTIKILGVLMMLMVFWFLATGTGPLNQIIIMGMMGLLLLGYSIAYEITAKFENKRHFKIFGITLFSSKLEIQFPDYMVVFSAKHKQGAAWGPVGAMGKERTGDSCVIRLFKGTKYFTIYRNKSMQKAEHKAIQLSDLIGVEIRGKS